VLTLSGTPVIVVVVLLAGLLGYAYVLGRRAAEPDEPADEGPDEPTD
jgi:hypothetical protein